MTGWMVYTYINLYMHVSSLLSDSRYTCYLLATSPPPKSFGKNNYATMLQWDAPISLPELPLPLWRSPPLSNAPIPWPTPLTIPNSIRIQSAVLPQYTFRTDRPTDTQTDRWTRRQVYTISAYARYIDRERRANNKWKSCFVVWSYI